MEIKQETIKGASVDTTTGNASVPNSNGGVDSVHVETKVLFEDTYANRQKLARLFEKNGMHAEAAQLRGEKYDPTLTGQLTDVLKDNTSLIRATVVIAIGALTYYVGAKAFSWISKKMGWGIASGATLTAQVEPETSRPNGASSRRMPSTQLTASA